MRLLAGHNLAQFGRHLPGHALTGEIAPTITGTAPSLAALTQGDTLDERVTWGSATAPDGETLTGASPIREQQIDGAAWEAYAGATAPAAGATVAVRERWATVEGTTATFTSATQIVAYLVPTITQQPQLAATYERGAVIDLLAVAGAATPAGAVASIEALTYNGADISGGIVAGDYNTSGLSAYGNDGALALQIRWTNGDQSTLSEVDTATLIDVPAAMAAPSLEVDSSSQITATLAAAPDNGNSAITGYDLRWQADEGAWTEVLDITSPHEITGLDPATLHNVQTRAVNAVGNAAWSASASATTDDAAFGGTAPTIASTEYDDTTDRWTITTTAPNLGQWIWGRFADGTTGITANGSGGFSGGTPDASGTLTVGAAGAPIQIPDGGTNGTAYELVIYQWDGVTASNVLTTGYTAGAPASGITYSIAHNQGYADSGVTIERTATGIPLGDASHVLLIAPYLVAGSPSTATPFTLKMDGTPVTQTAYTKYSDGVLAIVAALVDAPAGPNFSMSLERTGTDLISGGRCALTAIPLNHADPISLHLKTQVAGGDNLTLNTNTVDGGLAVAVSFQNGDDASPVAPTFSGITLRDTAFDVDSAEMYAIAVDQTVLATPRSMSVTANNSPLSRHAAIALTLEAVAA